MFAKPSLFLTQSSALRRARTTNQTSASFVDKLPTRTEPAADTNSATAGAAVTLGRPAEEAKAGDAGVQNLALVTPYALGSDTNTFSMRVIGWQVYPFGSNNPPAGWNWIPIVLVEVLCTISSTVPGGGGDILATEFFCKTISVVGTTGNPQSYEILSPTQDKVISHLVVDLKGSQKIEFSFSTGSSATSCNCLWRMY